MWVITGLFAGGVGFIYTSLDKCAVDARDSLSEARSVVSEIQKRELDIMRLLYFPQGDIGDITKAVLVRIDGEMGRALPDLRGQPMTVLESRFNELYSHFVISDPLFEKTEQLTKVDAVKSDGSPIHFPNDFKNRLHLASPLFRDYLTLDPNKERLFIGGQLNQLERELLTELVGLDFFERLLQGGIPGSCGPSAVLRRLRGMGPSYTLEKAS
jgi:hypothetical protein